MGNGYMRGSWTILVYQVLFDLLLCVADWPCIAHFITPALAKILVTPVSFYTNFLFMGWLLTGRIRNL